jgi:GNAT superfamily N-acetyltransferase
MHPTFDESRIEVVPAAASEFLPRIRSLFREYAAASELNLCFQNFEQELAALPGRYAPPAGRLFLARFDQRDAGCVGLRALSEQQCEMKRLYVRPFARRQRIGRRLAETVIAEARGIGYSQMVLDTLDTMTEALELYRSLGFVRIPRYNENPLETVIFLGLDLG